jgi:hypothetical protein
MFWLLVIIAGLLGQPLILVAALLLQVAAALRRTAKTAPRPNAPDQRHGDPTTASRPSLLNRESMPCSPR